MKPPTFVLFVNDPELVHFSTERFLENQIRERFTLEGTPIRLKVRESSGKEAEAREKKPRRRIKYDEKG